MLVKCAILECLDWKHCTNKEQAWNGNTVDLLTDYRSLHQWLLWLAIASSASAVASGVG